MKRVKILVVCGSGVATSMHVAYNLKQYLENANLNVIIDGAGNNELPFKYHNYDIIVSNTQVTIDTDKPVFNSVPLLTGIGKEALVEKIIEAVKEIQNKRGNED